MFYFDTRFWGDSWWLWDIAVVVLNQPLGRRTGYFGVGYRPAGYSGPLATAGYPGDKALWSLWQVPGAPKCVVRDDDGSDTVLVRLCISTLTEACAASSLHTSLSASCASAHGQKVSMLTPALEQLLQHVRADCCQ
jgi:hypothetical protein